MSLGFELPPFDQGEFDKFRQGKQIVKESDMEPTMLSEAKDHIVSGIEKNSGSEGIDIQNASKFIKENMDR